MFSLQLRYREFSSVPDGIVRFYNFFFLFFSFLSEAQDIQSGHSSQLRWPAGIIEWVLMKSKREKRINYGPWWWAGLRDCPNCPMPGYPFVSSHSAMRHHNSTAAFRHFSRSFTPLDWVYFGWNRRSQFQSLRRSLNFISLQVRTVAYSWYLLPTGFSPKKSFSVFLGNFIL